MKRCRLKPMSAKRKKLIEKIGPERLEFRREMGRCCIGGCKSVPGCVHEIVGGSSRWKTASDRRFWLACCWEHHLDVLQDMPRIHQLAIKRHVDPGYYDLKAFNRAITGKSAGVRATSYHVKKAARILGETGVIRSTIPRQP